MIPAEPTRSQPEVEALAESTNTLKPGTRRAEPPGSAGGGRGGGRSGTTGRLRGRGRPVWVVVAAAAVAMMMTAPGQTSGVSAFIDSLIAELDVSRTDVSTAYLIGTLCGALALPVLGRLLDRYGIAPVMAVVALLFGAVLFALSFVNDLLGLTAGFAGIRMAGQGALGLIATTAVAVHVTRRRGLALGVASALGTGGISLAPVVLERLIAAYGTADTWRLEAVAVWVVVLPLALLVFRTPGTTTTPLRRRGTIRGEPRTCVIAQNRRGPASGEAGSVGSWTRGQAMRTPMFWVIAAGLAASGMLSTALNFHQISLLGEQGLSPVQAAANFVPQTIAGLLATLGAGALVDRVAPKWCVSLSMLLLSASLLAVPAITPGLRAIGYGVLLGAAGGAIRAIEAAAYARYFGTAHLGAIRGVVSSISVGSTAFGPLLLAAGHDLSGNYATTVLVAAVIPCAVGLAIIFVPGPSGVPRT